MRGYEHLNRTEAEIVWGDLREKEKSDLICESNPYLCPEEDLEELAKAVEDTTPDPEPCDFYRPQGDGSCDLLSDLDCADNQCCRFCIASECTAKCQWA